MNAEPRSSAFERLDPRLREWVWSQGWTNLRDIQEACINLILAPGVVPDIVIAAPTAGGKTEAAFLPIASRLACQSGGGRPRALCVSPLKALINDQGRRLEGLLAAVDLEVHLWHGDVTSSRKQRLVDRRGGESVLLITPESLEALFVRRGSRVRDLFSAVEFLIVDELHAFLGNERGRQMASLLQRIESGIGRRMVRVGLSATLGDLSLAAEALRPGGGPQVARICSSGDGQEVRVQVRTYVETLRVIKPTLDPTAESEAEPFADEAKHLALDLYRLYRGGHHLVFANRRADIELLSSRLRSLCEDSHVPNEFFPHHGSLSRSLREDAEDALRNPERPATVLATSTLELGIDVGAVQSVGQIGPPASVASQRQRLGRSGRRGEAAELRIFVREAQPRSDTPPHRRLHTGLVQSIAVVHLLAARWCEPPTVGALHLSTLVQQVLSVLAEQGGAFADAAYQLLCVDGPFRAVSKLQFARLLRDLARNDLLVQVHTGELVLGLEGERLVNHYDFFAAFNTSDEYRLVAGSTTLGTLPIDVPLIVNSFLIFGGRRWRIVEVEERRKVVLLVPAGGGRAPTFTGKGALVHDRIREEMRNVLESVEQPAFADAHSLGILADARAAYCEYQLAERSLLADGSSLLVFPWRGDVVLDTLLCLFCARGLEAGVEDVALCISECSRERLLGEVNSLLDGGLPSPQELAETVQNKKSEKHHNFLSPELLTDDYASSHLDLGGAFEVLKGLRENESP